MSQPCIEYCPTEAFQTVSREGNVAWKLATCILAPLVSSRNLQRAQRVYMVSFYSHQQTFYPHKPMLKEGVVQRVIGPKSLSEFHDWVRISANISPFVLQHTNCCPLAAAFNGITACGNITVGQINCHVQDMGEQRASLAGHHHTEFWQWILLQLVGWLSGSGDIVCKPFLLSFEVCHIVNYITLNSTFDNVLPRLSLLFIQPWHLAFHLSLSFPSLFRIRKLFLRNPNWSFNDHIRDINQ